MATVTSKATGNWSAGGTWDSDPAIPGAADDVVIAVGDVVTKDTALDTPGASDCAALTVTGKLIIATTRGVHATGLVSGAGEIEMRGTAELEYDTNMGANTLTFDVVGTDADNQCLFTCNSKHFMLYGTNGPHVFQYVLFDTPNYVGPYDITTESIFDYCDFKDASYLFYNNSTNFSWLRVTNSYISGVAGGHLFGFEGRAQYGNCVFGNDRDATDNDNVQDFNAGSSSHPEIYCFNCLFTSPTFSGWGVGTEKHPPIRSQGHNQVEGAWLTDDMGGQVFRSTDAKKTGDYGIEMVPRSLCTTKKPIYIDIPIPVETGDTPQPSIYYNNETADLGLEDAAGLLVIELDPGDEWGLNETWDANGNGESFQTWVQATFNAGDAAAGGTAAKGTLIMRVWLKKYVENAVVYLADPDDGM